MGYYTLVHRKLSTARPYQVLDVLLDADPGTNKLTHHLFLPLTTAHFEASDSNLWGLKICMYW